MTSESINHSVPPALQNSPPHRSFAYPRSRMLPADKFFQTVNLLSLLLDLRLLFVHCIYKNDSDLIVFDALDLAVEVMRHEQRFDLGDFFGDQAKIVFASLFPVEGDRPK